MKLTKEQESKLAAERAAAELKLSTLGGPVTEAELQLMMGQANKLDARLRLQAKAQVGLSDYNVYASAANGCVDVAVSFGRVLIHEKQTGNRKGTEVTEGTQGTKGGAK